MSVAEFSIKRPVTTVMFFVSMFVVGLIAAVRLPLEAFPAVTFPGIGIFLTVLSVSLVGDGLNDALNPRMHLR